MKKIPFILFLILSLIPVFSGVNSENTVLYRSSDKIPKWITSTPIEHYVGVSNRSETLESGINSAIENAFQSIMLNIGLKISSVFEVKNRLIKEGTVREIKDELSQKGITKIKHSFIKEIYYQKEKYFGDIFFNVHVLIFFPEKEVEESRKWYRIQKEKALMFSKEFLNMGDKELAQSRVISALKYYDMALKRCIDWNIEEEELKIRLKISNLIDKIRCITEVQKNSKIMFYCFYQNNSEKYAMKDIIIDLDFTRGSGIVDKKIITDNKGVAYSNIYSLLYEKEFAVLKANIQLNNISEITSELLKTLEFNVTIKKDKSTICIVENPYFKDTDQYLSQFFSNIESIYVQKYYSDKSLQKILEETGADFIIRGNIKRIDNQYYGNYDLINKDKNIISSIKEKTSDQLSLADKVFNSFASFISNDLVYLKKIEVFPSEITQYFKNTTYNLENIQIKALYSDNTERDVYDVEWEVLEGKATIEGNTLKIDQKTGELLIQCTLKENGLIKKENIKIKMHWKEIINVNDAIDNQVPLITKGSGKWVGVSHTSFDGIDSLVSDINKGDLSLIIRLEGPATVSFNWKTDSQYGEDVLFFNVNGSMRWIKTGKTDWEKKTITLTDSKYELEWKFRKSSDFFSEKSRVFIDNISIEKSHNFNKDIYTGVDKVPFGKRIGHCLIEKDNILYLIGGESNNGLTNDLWISKDGVEWDLKKQNLDFSPRKDFQITEFKNKYYMSGGVDRSGKYKNDIYRSSDLINWVKIVGKAEWSPRKDHGFISKGKYLYIIGGNSKGTLKNDIWRSEDAIHWNIVNEKVPFSARTSFKTINVKNKVIILGGHTENGTISEIWSTTDLINWKKEKTPQWTPRCKFGLTQKTFIWIVGGVDLAGNLSHYKKDIWYSQNGIDWNLLTTDNSLFPMGDISISSLGKDIIITGGRDILNNIYKTFIIKNK